MGKNNKTLCQPTADLVQQLTLLRALRQRRYCPLHLLEPLPRAGRDPLRTIGAEHTQRILDPHLAETLVEDRRRHREPVAGRRASADDRHHGTRDHRHRATLVGSQQVGRLARRGRLAAHLLEGILDGQREREHLAQHHGPAQLLLPLQQPLLEVGEGEQRTGLRDEPHDLGHSRHLCRLIPAGLHERLDLRQTRTGAGQREVWRLGRAATHHLLQQRL